MGEVGSFEAEIVGLDDVGSGLAELAAEGGPLRVHVPGALPGERVEGRITYRSVHARARGREAWASLLKVERTSPDRVPPVCPAYGVCGGCALMHLAYPAQLAWKRERVRAEFAQHSELARVEVSACVASPVTFAYRNQAKYVCARSARGDLVLGAYAPDSHDVVDLAGCRVVEPVLDHTRRELLGILGEYAIEPYHETRRTGVLRYVLLRANQAGEVLATLVAARADWADAPGVAAELVSRVPAVTGVVLNRNSGTGNALFGDDERLLVGQPTLGDEVGGVRVRLASRSFFQANRAVASLVYRDLVAGLSGDFGRGVDAYSGAGGIALSLLARVRDVVAIEANAAATEACQSSNESPAGVTGGLRIVTADAAVGMASLDGADLVVLNPPRKGCSAEVLSQVRRLSPRQVAYLSCDPTTLARDLGILVKSGAVVTGAVPYDMMPHTPHVETLVRLSLPR